VPIENVILRLSKDDRSSYSGNIDRPVHPRPDRSKAEWRDLRKGEGLGVFDQLDRQEHCIRPPIATSFLLAMTK